jgi:DNA-directed RNA polymerase subunit RPC12/RpoP
VTRKHYRCPNCSRTLAYDHHPSIEADPLPEGLACPGCGYADTYEPAVVAPHIQRPILKNVDGMHRDMEAGEQFRANVAMEKFGLDAAEAKAMVQTNSADNLRAGDISAMPVNNAVTHVMDQAPHAFGWGGGQAQGAALSPQVQAGLYPNAGAKAMAQVRAVHGSLVASTGHQAAVSTSLPALETQAPGYRQRA